MPRAKETNKTREQRVTTVTSLRQRIAALERTVELLQKERDTFFSILERAPYGVVLLDKEGKTLFTNTAFTTITGYTLEDVPTISDWVRLAYPDKRYGDEISASETWKRNKAQRETNGLFQKMLNRVFFRSFSVVCKDGTVKEIEFKPRTLDDGSTLVTLADITERKRAEEAFRESEKQFRLLIQHVPDILSVHDIDGNIIDMNQQACESLGYTRDEFFSLRVQDIEQNFTVGKHTEQWKHMVPGVPILLHGVHKRKNGTTFPVEIRIGMFESGGKKLFLALVRDVSERKQMEEKLQKSQQELQSLMDASPVAISWADLQGNIQYINHKHHELFGYTLEDIPTIADWRRQADQDPAQSGRFAHWEDELMEAHRQGRSLPSQEMTVTCKDGSVRYVTIEGTIVSNHNLVIYNDITERKQMEEELRESEERFKMLAEHAPLGISIIAPNRSFEYLNPQFTKIFGYTIEDIPDKDTWFEKAYPDKAYRNKVISIWKRDTAEEVLIGEENPRVFTVRCKDGQDKIIDFRRVDLVDGKQYQVYEDITARAKAEEALRESEKRYRQIIYNADDIIYEVDNRGYFTLINPVAARITRYSEHELIGRHYLDLVNPAYRKDTERFYRLQFVRKRQNTYYELPIITKDGTEVWLGQNVQLVVEAGQVVGYQAVARDITNRKRAVDTMRELAYQDALTGLPNRVLFNDRFSMALAQARRHQQRLGIMLLDLDHFKNINDTLGHSVGDKLLRVVGERLTGQLRSSDTIARMGGDEFLLLLTEIARLNDVITIAQKILEVFRQPFVIDDHELMITTSIGITIFPDDGDTADVLLKNADIAMYRAKERGRDNFQCYSSAPR